MTAIRLARVVSIASFVVFAAAPASAQVDPILLNVTQFGGKVNQASTFSRLGGTDDPTEAFGNPTGPFEPGTFIFEDNGAGGEESISITTSEVITLNGLRIIGGGVGDGRSIGLVNVFASKGAAPSQPVGSIADFNDAAGFHDIPFFTGPFQADQIVMQFGTPENGARVAEVDALVPEPAATGVLSVLALGLLRRRTRG